MPRNSATLRRLPPPVLPAALAALLVLGLGPHALPAQEAPAGAAEPAPNPKIFGDESDQAPPLPANLLRFVSDSAGMPLVPPPPANRDPKKNWAYDVLAAEYDAYWEAVVRASRTSTKAFANSARHDLTYAHLFSEPAKYRGQVIHFEGRLKRVRRFDASPSAVRAGVPFIYEGWVFAQAYGANPTCIVFTELPPGVPVAEDMYYQVSFDGYFFKKYRYHAADSKPGQAREAPLLIGRAPVVLGAVAAGAEEPASPWASSGTMLALLFGLILGTLGLAFGLHVWFRRSDRGVRARLAAARAAGELELGDLSPPAGAPAEGGSGHGHGMGQTVQFPWHEGPGVG